jgi:ribonucleotide reductase beta subunit family protein with ferritin-like domain
MESVEELLTETKNRFVIYPIKYDKIWKMFKTAESSFWTAEEVDLSKDIDDWDKLSDNERYFIKHILAFFAASDGIVNENLVLRFYNEVKIAEARAFYGFQVAIENIHCVSGDTQILSDAGYVEIKDHVNQKINIWNGNEFSEVTVRFTGNSELIKVTLSNGMELTSTPDHKWYTQVGNQKHITFTKDLKIDNVVYKYNLPILNPQDPDEFQNPYIHGLFCGDGTCSNGFPSLSLYGEKMQLIKYIPNNRYSTYDNKINIYLTHHINKPKFNVPINYSINTKLRWLEGISDANGCINTNYKKDATSIQISNTNYEFLKDVQLLLSTLGVNSNIKISCEECSKLMPTHNLNNDYVEYMCQKCYVLYITCCDVSELCRLGFSPKRLKLIINNDIKPKTSLIKVIKIEKIEGIHPTFCFNEPKNHSGIFNGILTGQSEMYSLMIDTFIKENKEKDNLFNAIDTIPCIKKKAEWALKWIEDKETTFAKRLIAFAVVEGIFFSGAFCSIFWLKERGLMPGLCTSNEFISRDEGLHCEFAALLYSMIKNRLSEEEVSDLIREAVDIEIEFITDSIPCNLLGMNAELMKEYIKFVADRLIVQLGYEKLYNSRNPFPFMDRINLEHKTNFFENRESNYSKANVGQKNAHEFSIDEEF